MEEKQIAESIIEKVRGYSLLNGFTPNFIEKAGVDFLQKEKDRELSVGVDIIKFGAEYQVGQWGSSITFKQVEEICTPLLVKSKIIGEVALEQIRSTVIYSEWDAVFNDGQRKGEFFPINELSDLNEVIPIFINHIETEYFPFFDKFPNMQSLIPLMSNLNGKNLRNLIGSGAVFKKIIIHRLCGDPNYESDIDALIDRYKNALDANPSEVQIERFYNMAIATKEKLKDVSPIYSWSDI